MRCFATTLLAYVALAPLQHAAAQLPPDRERAIIAMLTDGGFDEWNRGHALSRRVLPHERSPALRAAMREALRRSVYDLDIQVRGGEGIAILTMDVAAHADPADIPVLAQVTVGGPAAKTLYNWGHQATPHLIEAVLSPEVSGDVVRVALDIVNAILIAHGPGSHAEALAGVSALHLDGPPPHYRSREFPSAMREAISLAGLLRTPGLLRRLEEIAASTPEELTARTGQDLIITRNAPNCAKIALDGEVADFCGHLLARLADPDLFLEYVTNSPDGRGGEYWRRKEIR